MFLGASPGEMVQYAQLTPLIGVSLIVGLATLFGTFFVKLYRARMLLIERQKRGLPVAPGHSFLFGHLLYLKTYLDRIPKDAHYQYAFGEIGLEHFSDTGAYYMDLWPMTGATLLIISPTLLSRFFEPITGGPNMFSVNEAAWKPWRSLFNKGFHSDHINAFVPGMVHEVLTYADTLHNLAKKGDMVFLEPITLRFMIDVIGKTTLNSSLGSQTGYNALADGMLSQIQWWHDANNYKLEIFSKLNFVRAFMQWKNSRQMNQYIGAELDKRHAEYKADPESAKGVSIMDMVLRAYLSETPSPPAHLDAEFRASVIRQIRLFVFAGHDSTATSIVYTFHLLSKHPEVLARLRAEHDDVLGPDPKAAASKISDDPRLVNSLTYTLAVIKEAMRLFPPAGASRDGVSGVNITDDAGNSCPTDDTILWVLHGELHQGDKYWVKAQEFLPERWMVPPGHLLYPRPGTWRSFEVGPRNCIAQAMVLIELRVVLACLVRTFDVTPAYGEWDEKRGATGNRHVRGERVYQIERGAADPVGGYPCRITLAKPSTK